MWSAHSQPSLPTSPLLKSTDRGNTKEVSQAPPAHEMHFMALLIQFLMSNMPCACRDTEQ